MLEYVVTEGWVTGQIWRSGLLEERQTRMEQELTRARGPVIVAQIMQSVITPQQLLDVLATNPQKPSPGASSVFDVTIRDIALAHAFGQEMSAVRQARVGSLLQDSKFQSWFKAAHSQTLVIDGMEDNGMDSALSPLTFLCTLLSKIVSEMRIAEPLTFFCGQHATPGDQFEGASGVMRSLCSQILISHGENLNLAFLDFATLQAISNHDMVALCRLFEALLERVGRRTIFCMIDGISWYETEARSRDMHVVMPFLQSLIEAVEGSSHGLVFKLLVTSPILSQYTHEWFPSCPRILMQTEIEGDGEFGKGYMMAEMLG